MLSVALHEPSMNSLFFSNYRFDDTHILMSILLIICIIGALLYFFLHLKIFTEIGQMVRFYNFLLFSEIYYLKIINLLTFTFC